MYSYLYEPVWVKVLVSKDGYSKKLQYKHYNEKKQRGRAGGGGGGVKDMEFSGIFKKIASGFSKD